MKALFLAAGFSTRLSPLTDKIPKGLLKLHGAPIISYLLNQVLETPGVSDVALITNDRDYQQYHQYLRDQKQYQQIIVINNGVKQPRNRLGAIGDLSLAIEMLNWQEDLLVLPSDTLTSIKISELIKFYETHPGFINVVFDAQDVDEIKNKLGCAVVEDSRLIEFIEKPAHPPSTLQSVPIYIYPKKILPLITEYIETGNNLDSPGAIIPWLLQQTECFAFELENGYYYDVGTVEMYQRLSSSLELFPFSRTI